MFFPILVGPNAQADDKEQAIAAYSGFVGNWSTATGVIFNVTKVGEDSFVFRIGQQATVLTAWDSRDKMLKCVGIDKEKGAFVQRIWVDGEGPTIKVQNIYGAEFTATATFDGKNQFRWAPSDQEATVITRLTGPNDLRKEWWNRFKGDWTYEWKGGFEETGTASWNLAAKQHALIGRFQPNGTEQEVEVTGFQADSNTTTSTGFSSNGGYWHIEWAELTEKTMRGTSKGVFPDGRAYTGTITTRQVSDDELASEMELTIDGKEVVKSTDQGRV